MGDLDFCFACFGKAGETKIEISHDNPLPSNTKKRDIQKNLSSMNNTYWCKIVIIYMLGEILLDKSDSYLSMWLISPEGDSSDTDGMQMLVFTQKKTKLSGKHPLQVNSDR